MSTSGQRHDGLFPYIPLVLIFSTRDKIRDILSVGLIQCHYRITQAHNSHMATIKANQFTPDLVIADITENNTKDIILINRLQSSGRTKNIPFLAIVPKVLKEKLENVIMTKTEKEGKPEPSSFSFLEYPFSFSDLLTKIKSFPGLSGKTSAYEQQGAVLDKQISGMIAKRLVDSTVPVEAKLREIASHLQRQWVFPFTVVKALDIIGSESSCTADLAKCIKSDVSASAAILKVANTVQFAKRQNRVTDVKEAVVRIGFQETRSLLSCFGLIDLSKIIAAPSGFTRTEFWVHSLAVANIASELCSDCNYRRPELSFVAGLLHDLGKIPLDNNFSEIFQQLLEETTIKISTFYKTEQLFMNFSHAELGHYLTTEWNLPPSITNAILYHHNPEAIKNATPVIDRILFESIFVANQISKAMDLGHSCDEILEEIPAQMLRDLNLLKGPTDRFLTTVIRNINQMSSYLNIPIKKMTLSQPAPEWGDTSILFVHGDHPEFHPLVLALRHKGYNVLTAKKVSPEHQNPSIRVIFSILDSGAPLDIVLYDDDHKNTVELATLKIFIVDMGHNKSMIPGFANENMIFVNREKLDLRYILYELDNFFGKVVLPKQSEIEPPAGKVTDELME